MNINISIKFDDSDKMEKLLKEFESGCEKQNLLLEVTDQTIDGCEMEVIEPCKTNELSNKYLELRRQRNKISREMSKLKQVS